MSERVSQDNKKLCDKIPLEYKQLWNNIPKVLKRTFIVIFIVLIISTFFTVYYFTDGLEELVNMSRQVTTIKE